MKLTYDTLVKAALHEVKELEEERSSAGVELDDGPYYFFSLVFTPLLITSIRNGNEALTTSMLDFLEKMSASEEDHVVEVCDYGVLEILAGEIKEDEIVPLLRESTKEGYWAVREYIGPPESAERE